MSIPGRYVELPFEPLIVVSSWEEFLEKIEVVKKEVERVKLEIRSTYTSPLLFRGHANNTWKLLSTLQRSTNSKDFEVSEYLKLVQEVSSSIHESVKDFPQLQQWDQDPYMELLLNSPEGLQYLKAIGILRHHNFPTPLLDWSTSIDVAAYFAFSPPDATDFRSIYVFIEYWKGGKMIRWAAPHVQGIGNSIEVHRRHIAQESWYTMTTVYKDGKQYFAPTEEAYLQYDKLQDYTLKFDIPSKERQKVMSYLNSRGVNTVSLMGKSDDSLIRDLSLKYF